MSRAIVVAWAMSWLAPVDTSFVSISSAMRPPQHMRISARKWRFVRLRTSFSGSAIVEPRARPRGIIVTLWSGSASGSRT